MAKDYYQKHAQGYDKLWEQYTAKTLDKVMERMPSMTSKSILDYGCGTGELIRRLILRDDSFGKIVGYDPSDEMLQVSHKKIRQFDDATQKKVTLRSDPKFTQMFDIIISVSAFHYFQNPNEVLKTFKNLLNKGGLLIIVDYAKESLLVRYFEWFIRLIDKAHQKAYSLGELSDLVENAGFEMLESEKFKISTVWKGIAIKATC